MEPVLSVTVPLPSAEPWQLRVDTRLSVQQRLPKRWYHHYPAPRWQAHLYLHTWISPLFVGSHWPAPDPAPTAQVTRPPLTRLQVISVNATTPTPNGTWAALQLPAEQQAALQDLQRRPATITSIPADPRNPADIRQAARQVAGTLLSGAPDVAAQLSSFSGPLTSQPLSDLSATQAALSIYAAQLLLTTHFKEAP